MKSEETIIELFGKMPYKSLVEEIIDYAIFHLDTEGRILSWNLGAEKIFGYGKNEIIGQDFNNLFIPEDRAQSVPEQELKKAIETGRAEDTRWHLRKDDTRFFAQGFTTALRDENGKVIGFAKIARDDTAHKQMEEALLESEERYRIVAETASDAIISIDEQSTILFINPAAERIFGYEVEQMINQPLTMLMPEYLRYVHSAGLARYLETGKRHISWEHVEVPGLHREGHEFPLELSFGEFNKNNKRVFIGIARDITRRKCAEEALRESEKQLRILVDSIPQLAWMAEPDGFIFWYNHPWYEYTGTTPDQMKGWGWKSVHSEEMLPQVIERWNRSIATGEPFEMEFPLKGADGEFRWFLTRVNPLRDSQGNITRWFGTNTDIHENRIAQRNAEFLDSISEDLVRLRTIEEMMQTIGAKTGEFLNLSVCGFIEINETADEAVVTHNWHREDIPSLVGVYRLKEFLTEDFQRAGRAGEIFVVSDVFDDDRTDGENYAALKIGSFVCIPLVRNGVWRYLLAIYDSRSRNWRDDEIELMREMTNRVWIRIERARAEEERERLLQSEQIARQEAEQANRLKDEFLATISHELRTPLNAILGWSQMLQNSLLDEAGVKRALETIERNAHMQNQLIGDLLDVSRIITGKLRLDVRAVDLSGVIMRAVDAVSPAAEAKNIRLQTLLDPQAVPISGDPERLQQVVWNLLSNAIKFTPKNGHVQVRLERVNSHVEIVVSDTGAGIEPTFLPFVFERFRQSDGSTTRRYGGLGLGLAIVRQLVDIHGGTVSVNSAGAGQGSTFIVTLPLLPVRRDPQSEVPRAHPTAQNSSALDCPHELSGLRILLVDDETDSRDLLNFVLESCGAEVKTAGSTAEAMQLIGRKSFDIIISDIGMPVEDGYALISKIRDLPTEQGGNVPAIALTAYARAEDRVRALRSGFQLHIAKPVESTELIAAVANLAGRIRKSSGDVNK